MAGNRTVFAQKAVDLASSFMVALGQERLAGNYSLQMAAPDGPSTGGGKQGVQHISLRPENGGATIVVGSANQGTMTAELRTYGSLATIQLRRSPGAALAFDETAYRGLVDKMSNFFGSLGMKVAFAEEPTEAAPATAEPVARSRFPWKVLALAGGLLVLLLLAVLLFRR